MTPTLSQLLSARPKAVEAINRWIGIHPLDNRSIYNASEIIREYAYKHDVDKDTVGLSSLEALLDLIESRCVAEAPLSDAEIEGMKWKERPIGSAEYHNDNIDRCHREIKRLRKEPTNA